MIIISNNIIPFKGFSAMYLCGLLFVRADAQITSRMLNHEKIHDAQARELLYIGFYVLYVLEWIYGLFKYKSSTYAYRSISFEKEAYKHQDDANYLANREYFAEYKKEML